MSVEGRASGRFGNGNLGRDELLLGLGPLDALQSEVLCKFVNHTLSTRKCPAGAGAEVSNTGHGYRNPFAYRKFLASWKEVDKLNMNDLK